MQLEDEPLLSPLTSDEFHDIMSAAQKSVVEHIAVAVSGGGDSMALCYLLNQWCQDKGVKLTVLTVDHGLRDDSAIEAKQVGKWLETQNIDHKILEWSGDKPKNNIQDEARKARYTLMGKWCSDHDIERLFLAHHQGDQAETFLIRLFRGSGVDGLSAMENEAELPVSEGILKMPKLYRPLLNIPKARLLGYLTQQGYNWLEDPSNKNETYTRVKVRELINSSDIDGLNSERLSQTAIRMRRVRSLLEELTANAESEFVTYNEAGYAILTRNFQNELHEEISLRLLSSLLKNIGGGTYPPRHIKLNTLFENLKNNQFSGQTLSGCTIFTGSENNFIFAREASYIKDEIIITKAKRVFWDNRFSLNFSNENGIIKKLDDQLIHQISLEFPDFIIKMNNHFGNKILRQKVLPTLPCLLTNEGKVVLPDILAPPLSLSGLNFFQLSLLNKS